MKMVALYCMLCISDIKQECYVVIEPGDKRRSKDIAPKEQVDSCLICGLCRITVEVEAVPVD